MLTLYKLVIFIVYIFNISFAFKHRTKSIFTQNLKNYIYFVVSANMKLRLTVNPEKSNLLSLNPDFVAGVYKYPTSNLNLVFF